MDSFPRPDIAEGIFYEYLRLDDPMSVDFLDHVVDGFPMLLAPLSQVDGIATPMNIHQTSRSNINNVDPFGNSLFRFFGGVGDVISSQAVSLADMVQSGATEIAGGALNKVRTISSAAKKIGEEVERRRGLLGKHVSTFTSQALSSIIPAEQKAVSIPFPGWITDNELEELSQKLVNINSVPIWNDETIYIKKISRIVWFKASSMSVSYITQKLIFGMVHMYLLLLLIASFPTKWSTRKKRIIVRKPKSFSSSYVGSIPVDSENSDSDDSVTHSTMTEITDSEPIISRNDSKIRTTLSYAL